MMVGSPYHRRRRIVSDINMIPLIDVALVLLIIFMVLAPVLVRSQIEIRLPQAEAVEPEDKEKMLIEVEIDRTGKIWIENVAVSEDAIDETFRNLTRTPGKRSLVISADEDVAFQHVVKVMDAGKKNGIGDLAVSVRRKG